MPKPEPENQKRRLAFQERVSVRDWPLLWRLSIFANGGSSSGIGAGGGRGFVVVEGSNAGGGSSSGINPSLSCALEALSAARAVRLMGSRSPRLRSVRQGTCPRPFETRLQHLWQTVRA